MSEKLVFAGARLKIKRANQHIQDLHTAIRSYGKSRVYDTRVERDAERGLNILVLKIVKPLSPQIGLILGDAIHNLHTALDHVYCEILRREDVTLKSHHKFPFKNSRQELVNGLNGGEIQRAGSVIVDLILNTVKPYRGSDGNDALLALHDLDITDKHIIMIPALSQIALSNLHIRDDTSGSRFVVGQGGLKMLKLSGSGTLRIESTGTFNKTQHRKAAVHVLFADGQFFEGQSVLETAHQLSKLVSGIVEAFEKAYVATRGGLTVTHWQSAP